jgi:uncharacterized membrane protein YGL010W
MSACILKRSALVGAALIQLALLALGLLIFGIHGVNIDSLQHRPILFTLLLLVPSFGAGLASVLAASPRILQINLIIFVCLWLIVELVFGVVNHYRPTLHDDQEGVDPQHEMYADDAVLGYKALPNAVERHIEEYGTRKIFNAIYKTDEMGRRETPVPSKGPRPKFILFFGDSYTFGWGLGQRQTLPYYVGELAPDYQPYNYGLSGWGPAQMLDVLKTRDLKHEIKQKEGFAIFYLIDDHVGRVIGANFISADWGSHLSHYVLDDKANLVREGNFATGRPFTTLFYKLLDWSNVVQYFGLELPLHYSDQDYLLTARILADSEKILAKEFKLDGFFVILSVDASDAKARLVPYLRGTGVKCLDFTDLWRYDDLRYSISRADSHNSPLAYRVVAARLVKELGIGAAPAGWIQASERTPVIGPTAH